MSSGFLPTDKMAVAYLIADRAKVLIVEEQMAVSIEGQVAFGLKMRHHPADGDSGGADRTS